MTTVRAARAADIPAVEALLTSAALPLDGAEAAFRSGVVAEEEGEIVAAAAAEPWGAVALLRSVVVRPDRRGEALGRGVVAAVEREVALSGGSAVYLLTETAAGWFDRLGYRRIAREDVPPAVRESVEFTTACADTAIAMVKPLSAPERR